MPMLVQGVVGPQLVPDGGAPTNLRQGRLGDLIVSELNGRFYEQTVRGRTFFAMTATAGVSIASLTITTAAPFTLLNPFGSGINLSVLHAGMQYVSGTIGTGTLYLAANTNPSAAIVTGTAITATNGLLGGPVGIGRAFTTSTLPASPTIIRPYLTAVPALATTVTLFTYEMTPIDGEIVIAPGCALSFAGVTAAGTSPLVQFGMAWNEVPI